MSFFNVKQQHVTTMQRLWQRSSKQQGSGRERLRQTCTIRRARITTSCRSLRTGTARPSTATRRHRFWRSVTSPWCSLIPQSPPPSRRRSGRDQRKLRRTRQMRDASAKPSASRQGKATKKGCTSENCKAEASVEHRFAVQERVQQGFHASDDLGAKHRDRRQLEVGATRFWTVASFGASVGYLPRAREAAFLQACAGHGRPRDVTAASPSFVSTSALGSGSCPGNSEVL